MNKQPILVAPPTHNLSLFPVSLLCLLLGKDVRPFLAETFGLSPSRLRPGSSLANLRPSTERRILEFARLAAEKRAVKNGWTKAEFACMVANAPSVMSGEPRPFADFIHTFEIPGGGELTLTKEFAVEIDVFLQQLFAAHQANDIAAYKRLLLGCKWGKRKSAVVDAQERCLRKTIRSAQDWDTVFSATVQFVDNVVLLFLAAMDVEHGATYFQKFQSRPLFNAFLPKPNPIIDLESPRITLPRRNIVYRPMRRFLEFAHAMTHFAKYRRWPPKAAGRARLAESLDLDDQSVGNLLDGTRNWNAKLFESLWRSLCKNVVGVEPPFLPPLPLFLAAMFWQRAYVKTHPNGKVREVTILDDSLYREYWAWHRQRWASRLAPSGTRCWPAWLDA